MTRKKGLRTVKINVSVIDRVLRDTGKYGTQISREMGMNDGFISDVKIRGVMSQPMIKLFCSMYKVSEEELVASSEKEDSEKSKESNTFDIYLLDCISKISERVAILEKAFEQKHISLSENENCVLLLQQMTKYGGCEEKRFRDKAQTYGFTKESMEFAIKYLNCVKTLQSGKFWLEPKK